MIQLRHAFVLVLVSFTGQLSAQTQQKLTIDHATVFLTGAELTSTAHINLTKGENEILLTNVAGDVNSQSLNVAATNGVVVESATFQNNYLAAENISPAAQQIKDSIAIVAATRSQVDNKITVLTEQIALLQANRKVSGDNTGLSVAELTKMLDLISTKMEGYLNQKNREEETLKKTDERLAKLNKQLDEEQRKAYQPGGQLLVKFYAKDATATDLAISYVVPHAGWQPTYDIWADNASNPLKLYYKANIYQNSGVKWNNVRLTLSTGNPQEGVQAPTLSPRYLAFYQPAMSQSAEDLVSLAPGIYQSQRRKEVNVSGARSLSGTQYSVDGVEVLGTSMNDYVSVDNAGVNTSFDIDLPYTIPSDGQYHLVAIKKYDVPATYRYYAVPKLDKDAFLQAEITNWEDLNLLPGQTNIFYEGTYVGQGNIDVRNVKDTMTLSLGRDKKIIIKKEQDKQLRSTKTIGSNVKEVFAYTISIHNARKENINLVVQDQLPVSNDKDISVEDKDIPDATYDETTGMLKWTVSLNANETKKIGFGYTVKYPKGKTIANLR